MIRDIYLGLLVTAVAIVSIAHRNLPRFDASTEVATETTAKELAAPKKETPAGSDALTTVFPEGYKGSKAKKSESSSRSSTKSEEDAPTDDKPKVDKPKTDKPKKEEEAAPAGAGPVLLVDEGPSLPVMPDLSEPEKKANVDAAIASKEKRAEKEKEEIVTEFVPFTETLSLPDDGAEKPSKDSIAKDEPKLPAESKQEEKQLAASQPELFPPPGKRDAVPASSEPPILALPQDHGSEPAGSSSKKRAAPAASKSDDLPPTVFSFDRRIATSDAPLAKDHSSADPVGGNPVHPFFARYLERKTYYVREGDTLESIALKLYQDRSVTERLFEVNKHQLRRPDDLRPGMLLRLP